MSELFIVAQVGVAFVWNMFFVVRQQNVYKIDIDISLEKAMKIIIV